MDKILLVLVTLFSFVGTMASGFLFFVLNDLSRRVRRIESVIMPPEGAVQGWYSRGK